MVPPYNEFAQRWGNPDFTEYVKQLEKQADQALSAVDENTADKQNLLLSKLLVWKKIFGKWCTKINL